LRNAIQSLNRRWQNFFALAIILCAAILFVFSTVGASTKKQLPARPFDLNTATLKQLEELPGVGPVTAHAILNFREKSGPFKSVNDLLVIPRISKKKLDKIRPYVFVKPPAAAKASAPPAKKSAPQKNQTVQLHLESVPSAFPTAGAHAC
jgi:competence protein ComEA